MPRSSRRAWSWQVCLDTSRRDSQSGRLAYGLGMSSAPVCLHLQALLSAGQKSRCDDCHVSLGCVLCQSERSESFGVVCTAAWLESQSLVCRNAGYEHPVDTVVEDLLACLDDPRLPLLQWNELYAVAQSRLPSDLAMQLEHVVGEALQAPICAVRRYLSAMNGSDLS